MIVPYETFDRFVAPLRVSSIKRVNIYFISLLAIHEIIWTQDSKLRKHSFLSDTMLLPICNKFVSLFVCSLLPSATFCATDHRPPRHFHGVLSGINGGVFLQPCVSSYFACYLHVDITPSGIKKTPFSKSYRFAKKNMDFSKKDTNETKTAKRKG